MVKQNFLTKMLLLCALIVGSVSSAWAQDKTNVSTVKTKFSANGDVTGNFTQTGDFTNTSWGLAVTWKSDAYWGDLNSTKGAQVGSGSKPATAIVLTGTKVPGTIKSVKVNSSVASGGTTTVGVEVGGVAFKCNNANTATLQTSATDYTFTGTSSGDVVLTWNQASTSKAIYIKSVTIKYEIIDADAPSALVSVSDLDFGKVYYGETKNLTFTVTPKNLESNLSVSCSNTKYEVTPTSIASNVTTATTITVTAKPTALNDNMNGTITISGGGLTDSKTVTLTTTVADPNAQGQVNNPYTVAQAIAATPSSGNVYIKGIVSSFQGDNILADGTNYRYYISDDGTTTTQLQVYKGKGLNNVAFDSADDLLLGDEVVIYGELITYQNAPEVNADNYIVSLNRKELVSIALSGNYTTTFVEGSEFNHEGVVVTATYNDQTTEDVTTKATFSEPDMTKIGEQTITVTYNGKTATYNITITAIPTHTVTFSVNGVTTTDDVKEGAAITFPEVTAPEGYTFLGWTTTEISGEQASAPTDLLTAANMGSADITYYAVFAIGEGTEPSLTKMESTDTFADGDNIVIVAYDEGAEKYYALYQETQNTSWVGKYEFDNNANTIAADEKNWLTVKASDNKWKLGDLTNGYLYSTGSNNLILDTDNSSDFTLGYSEGNGFTLKYGSRWLSLRNDVETNKFRLGGTGSTPLGVGYFDIYKFVAGSATYSNYCTTVVPATVTVNIPASRYGTYCSEYALDFSETDVEAYTAAYDGTSEKVVLNKISDGIVPANTGVVLYSTTTGEQDIPTTTTDATISSGNEMVGVTAQTVVPWTEGDKYNYILQQGKFKKATGASLRANRAYLSTTYDVSSTSGAPELDLAFGDETTGIQSIERTINDNQYYTLDGRRVAEPTKGIYIINGKKVVIK